MTFNPLLATVKFETLADTNAYSGLDKNVSQVICRSSKQRLARDQGTYFKTSGNVCASRAMQITVFAVMTEKLIYCLFY